MVRALRSFIIFFFILFSSVVFTASTANSEITSSFYKTLSPSKHGMKKEKLSYFHLYLHEKRDGLNATAEKAAETLSTKNSSTAFGAVFVADDPLTVGPKVNSKQVGRVQGMYAVASRKEIAVVSVLNFAFTEGKYNGSYLSLLGRHQEAFVGRELSVVGGSKLFELARGYAKSKVYSFDPKTEIVTFEYNITVYHY